MAGCKLCGREAQLVKAHIIPKSFWDIDPKHAFSMLTNTPGQFPRRSRIGVYDQTIVCETCERRFSDYDSYAAKVLLHDTRKFVPVRDGSGDTLAYVIPNINYGLLKLFGIAVLWRAGASSHSFFRRVKLGPYLDRARDMLLRADPGAPDDFGITLAIWNRAKAPILMDPFPERWDGINYYRLYLGRYLAYIKVDRRPVPNLFSPTVLRPNAPLVLIARLLERSKELPLMWRILDTTGKHLFH